MVDALDPACRAAASKESFGEAVRAARDAACEGVEKTKNMIKEKFKNISNHQNVITKIEKL